MLFTNQVATAPGTDPIQVRSLLSRFGLLIGIRFLNDCFLAVAVVFSIEPVIDRREQNARFDKVSVLLQNTFEQWQRVARFTRGGVGCRQMIASGLFARPQLNRTLQVTASFVQL